MNKIKFKAVLTKIYFLLCILLLINPFAVYGSSLNQVISTLVSNEMDMQTYLENDSDASIFVSALKQSKHWVDIGSTARTIFVPRNQALAAEGSAFLLEEVLIKAENRERLDDLMAIHMLTEELSPSHSIGAAIEMKTLGANCIYLEFATSVIKVSIFALATGAVKTTNGVVYYIDRMLWEPYDQSTKCL